MISLVRIIGRRIFSSQKKKRRWLSRAAAVLAVLRYLDKRTSSSERIVLKRNESLRIDVIHGSEDSR